MVGEGSSHFEKNIWIFWIRALNEMKRAMLKKLAKKIMKV